MDKKSAKETLLNAERELLICFAKSVILYRITEENKQRVFKKWNSEDFEVELHAAMKACNEMRDGVDESIDHLIEIVPEIRAYYAELKEMINKQKKEQNDRNNSTKNAN